MDKGKYVGHSSSRFYLVFEYSRKDAKAQSKIPLHLGVFA